MPLQINRDIITDFLFNSLSEEEMSTVADAILINADYKKIYEEEKTKILTHFYVDEELLPHECLEFKYKLKNDKQLLKEVTLQKEVNNSIENYILNEKLDESYQSTYQKKRYIIQNLSVKGKFKYWLAAASITILFILGGGITYFQTGDSLENKLYTKYYEPFTKNKNEYILNSSALSEAQQKYLKGDYVTALLLYKNLPSSLTIETERKFFMGLSLMELEQYPEAINHFQDVFANEEYPEYKPKVKWYMALCYLKTGEKEKSISILQNIVDDNDYNYKKANRILRRLDK